MDPSSAGIPGVPGAAITDQTPEPPAPEIKAEEPAVPSKRELADLQKNLRESNKVAAANAAMLGELLSALKGRAESDGAKASPSPPPAAPQSEDARVAVERVAELELKVGLSDAFAAANINDHRLRQLISSAAKAERPDNLAEFVARYATLATPPAKAATAPAPTPPPQAPPRSDTGSPAATSTVGLSSTNPADIDPAVFKSLPLEERRKFMHSLLSSGGHVNPTQRVR